MFTGENIERLSKKIKIFLKMLFVSKITLYLQNICENYFLIN